MTTKKTFILGVGAQKAGTTWLYKYIKNDPKANLGLLKEYHFWNAAFSASGKINKKKKTLMSKPHQELNSAELLRWTMLKVNNYYQIYFNSLINEGYQITGDLTPQHGRLRADRIKYIRDSLEDFGFTVKVIFLIRDPVERIWSNVRMEKSLYSSIDRTMSDSEAVKRNYKNEKWRWDTEYQHTASRIAYAFDRKNIYIGVYEEMFTEEKVQELSDFIGTDYNPSMIKTRVNESDKKEKLDDNVIREVRNYYKEVYKFCYLNFPQTKKLWDS